MRTHLSRVARAAALTLTASALVLGGLSTAHAEEPVDDEHTSTEAEWPGDDAVDQGDAEGQEDYAVAFLTEEPEDDYVAAAAPLFGSTSTVTSSLSRINATSPYVVPVSRNYSTSQNSYLVRSANDLVADQNRYLQALNCNSLKTSRDFWVGQGKPGYTLGPFCNALGIH